MYLYELYNTSNACYFIGHRICLTIKDVFPNGKV